MTEKTIYTPEKLTELYEALLEDFEKLTDRVIKLEEPETSEFERREIARLQKETILPGVIG